MTTEDTLWDAASYYGESVRYQSHSSMFDLLAYVLAYYQHRGTSPAEMAASPNLISTVNAIVAEAESGQLRTRIDRLQSSRGKPNDTE